MSTKIDLTNESDSQTKPVINATVGVRILNCEKQLSKENKTPMLKFQYEITTDSIKGTDGRDIKIAGLQAFDYIVFGDSQIPRQRLKALNQIIKVPLQLDIDDPAQLHPYKGKALIAQVTTKTTALKDGNGDPVLDDSGNVIADNNYKIGKFIRSDDDNTIPSENVAF